jgi:tRNA-binding protein
MADTSKTLEAFNLLDIRAGTVIRAEDFPEARKPAYKVWVDLGPLGIRKSSAQLTRNYASDELVGEQVLCVVNFPVRQIGPFMSELLILGLEDSEGGVILAGPKNDVPNGTRLY